jgi:hypothetical protein
MEFIALLTWLLLAGTGLILLPAAITTPGAGLVGLAGLGGLTGCILFLALGAPGWAAWVQVGMATLGLFAGPLAARRFCGDRFASGTGTEVFQAGTLGLDLPFFGVALFVSLLSRCTRPSRSSDRPGGPQGLA